MYFYSAIHFLKTSMTSMRFMTKPSMQMQIMIVSVVYAKTFLFVVITPLY